MFIPKGLVAKLTKVDSKEEVKKKTDLITGSLDQLFQDSKVTMDYNKLYDTVCGLVRNKKGQKLYDSVKKTFEKHTKSISNELQNLFDETFLKSVYTKWVKFKTNIGQSKDLLLFLDEKYVGTNNSHENKIDTIYDMGVKVFKKECVLKVQANLRRLILQMIEKERNNEEMADKFLLKNLCQMMVEIEKEQVYKKVFESPLTKASEIYFKKEALKFFEGSTAVGYLNRVKKRLQEERTRCSRCFDSDTLPKLEKVVLHEMIFKYKDLVVKKEGSGVLVMLENHYESELKLVYEVLSLVENALIPSVNMLKEYITKIGLDIIKNKKKNYLELVLDTIELRKYYEHLLDFAFSKEIKGVKVKDKDFSKAVKDAFGKVVNEDPRFPEYLSLLLDKKLKRGKNQVDEDGQDEFFDSVILTFHHVKEKDYFEKYYKIHLAKRLLSGRSASDDAEKTFLSKLKTSFGYQFTSKLEGMFKDMKVSEELMVEWKKFRKIQEKKKEKKPFDLMVQILTHVYWPLSTNPKKVIFPEKQLDIECDYFEKFYNTKHTGRKVFWQYGMGTADISGNFGKKYEFNVSTPQMVILLLFNKGLESNMLSINEIIQQTELTFNELRRNVFALCVPVVKGKAISKLVKRNAKKIETKTKIKLNSNFKSNKIKVKILPSVKKEDDKEFKATKIVVDEERKWVIDACIVRIMKMRKRLRHKQVVVECVEQLTQRFSPSPDVIKRRIESLIDREYLERDESNRSIYNYLA